MNLTNKNTGEKRQLTESEYIVGRSENCDIVIDEPTLSRRHAKLTREEEDWFVEDLGSTNGVKVNGVPLPAGSRRPLRPGDALGLGKRVTLLAEDEAKAEDKAKAEDEDHTVGIPFRKTASEVPVQARPVAPIKPQSAAPAKPQPSAPIKPQSAAPIKPQSAAPIKPQSAAPASRSDAAPGAAGTGKNSMQLKIEGKRKTANALGWVVIGLLAAGFLSFLFSKALFAVCILGAFVLWLIYMVKYAILKKILKKYSAEELNRLLEGEWSKTPDYPRSAAYCGERAIFCEKNNTLLPYEGLVWIYPHVLRYMGIPMGRSIVFRYLDGAAIHAKIAEGELAEMLRKYVLPRNPDIFAGYTNENAARYERLIGK